MTRGLGGDGAGLLVDNSRPIGMKMFETDGVVLVLRGWNCRDRFRSELMMLKMV